ncbi:hypothetical protein EWB00_004448 [Schistosoma japonicum]|uniref:Thioredoxin domain-containing protein n=2 Tax=Schistosoma japonicum TaxID=6182 RepID=A0A4Z2D585_SCHJA|nr:hypothetical protein KSF78_0003111 [Schistosoma japonicum]TNN11629.1 hypothetical protein EWB00_004448 [Schistosoma japonicum]
MFEKSLTFTWTLYMRINPVFLSALILLLSYDVFSDFEVDSRNDPHNTKYPNFPVKTIQSSINWAETHFLQTGWPLQIPTPGQSSIVPQCKLRKYNWINGSSTHIKFLHKSELSALFNSWSNSQLSFQPGYHTKHSDQLKLHECYILFIFSTTCRFSEASLPYINALARAYPQLPVYGIKVEDYVAHKWSLRMLFVPKLKIIVNGKVFIEYSGSDIDLGEMVDFIWSNMPSIVAYNVAYYLNSGI